jgi:drug/metabolite transporter (DMT)-like permease
MTLALPWYWSGPMPDWHQALLICSLGIYGGTGHFLLTRAFRLAPASTLSPFQYVQLVWATLLGWLVFGQLPDGLSMAGGLVIAASGVAIALDERYSGVSGSRSARRS